MKLLEATLASIPIARPIPTDEAPQGLCLDRGYDYDAVRELVASQRFVAHIRLRPLRGLHRPLRFVLRPHAQASGLRCGAGARPRHSHELRTITRLGGCSYVKKICCRACCSGS